MNWEAVGAIGEIVGAIAVIATLGYLAVQVRQNTKQMDQANRLARAEAYRVPFSDLNSLNSTFHTKSDFRVVFRQIVEGAIRSDIDEDQRILMDAYLMSITNIFEQLSREIKEGILDANLSEFSASSVFSSPYYKTSWPLYRRWLNNNFVQEFEGRFNLDPEVEVKF